MLSAVHQATVTLTALATAGRTQAETAGRAGRLVAPVSSLPEYRNIRRPFAPAPARRVELLLAAYDDAATASAQASREAAAIAADIRAPSRPLAIARAAIDADNPARLLRAARRAAEAGAGPADGPSGPVERQLRHLGITTPALLSRGRVLDEASDQLMLDAAQSPRPRRTPSTRARPGSPAAEPASHRPPRASRPSTARRSAKAVMTANRSCHDREPETPEAEP